MKIVYEITKKDVWNFQWRTVLKNKPLKILYILCALLILYSTIHPYFTWLRYTELNEILKTEILFPVLKSLFLNVFISFIFWIGFLLLLNLIYMFALIGKYKNGDGVLGYHEIILSENFLTERTDQNETRHSWKSINTIEQSKNYIYVYVSPTNAHIIPVRAFENDNAKMKFVDELNRYRENSKNNFLPYFSAA